MPLIDPPPPSFSYSRPVPVHPEPIVRLAQAILDGRVTVHGEDWTDRDGHHLWSFKIEVTDD